MGDLGVSSVKQNHVLLGISQQQHVLQSQSEKRQTIITSDLIIATQTQHRGQTSINTCYTSIPRLIISICKMAFIMPPDQFNSVPGLTESTTSMFSTRNFGDGLRMVYNTASAIKRTTSKAVSHPIFEKAIIQPLSRASTLPIIKEALVDPIKKLSENEHAMRIKESTDIFGRNLAEIIKPELFFERLEREEREGAGEIQVMERVAGSWSSEDSSALIKKKRPKKTHRRAREYLIGDEDTRSDYFSEGSEDPRISDIMVSNQGSC